MSENFSVLIVEDDDDVRTNMVDILSLDGYQIESVGRYSLAVSKIESQHFDAVIVDWRLPDGNGGQLVPLIKRELPNSPVIVVTGTREFDTAVTALRSGAHDFLTKPVNPDAFRMLLTRLVERKSYLMEIELAQSRLVASERLAAIGQMVAGLAHESRNVLQRSHACLAELTLDLKAMPESLKLVSKVQKALDDLNLLLEEVRVYSATILLDRRDCDIQDLVKQTWQHVLDANQPEPMPVYEMRVGKDVPDTWFVDCDRLRQVVRNLLENALFACNSPGKIVVELKMIPIRLRKHVQKSNFTSALCICISDDGDGISEANREKIFTPFFTTKTKGTGLGLAISRRITEAHGGQISISDSEFGGAKFDIELPVATSTKKARTPQ